MRIINRLLQIAFSLLMAISCVQSTEKYARKEHGKKFDIWKLNYNSKGYNVYWPSLELAYVIEGDLCDVNLERNWRSGAIIRRDTTLSAGYMDIKIYSVKSNNDAKYYNSVHFTVGNSDGSYRPLLEHRFLINEGQKDSLSFHGTSDSDDYVPSREISEKIVALLCEKKPINVKVTCQAKYYEGTYSFILEGSPKLKQALKLNEERKVLAQKEFDKTENKAAKEFMELFK